MEKTKGKEASVNPSLPQFWRSWQDDAGAPMQLYYLRKFVYLSVCIPVTYNDSDLQWIQIQQPNSKQKVTLLLVWGNQGLVTQRHNWAWALCNLFPHFSVPWSTDCSLLIDALIESVFEFWASVSRGTKNNSSRNLYGSLFTELRNLSYF